MAAGLLSQEQLAAKDGIHRTYVGKLERGEGGVTLELIAVVVSALGL